MPTKLSHGRNRRQFIGQVAIAGIAVILQKNFGAMLNPNGITIKTSTFSVGITVKRLLALFKDRGIRIYADIDQQKELDSVGISIPPMRLIIFGNPKTGSLILADTPEAGLDLPLKLLVWENGDKLVSIAYNTSDYLGTRYNLNQELRKLLDLNMMVNLVLTDN